MKNYDEMSENVLKRRDEELKLQKLKRKNRRQIALSCVASVAALGIVVGAVDYTRYTRDGAGFIFQAFKSRRDNLENSSGGTYTNTLLGELAPGEAYSNRKDVPDDINFVELTDFWEVDVNIALDPNQFQPMTLEQLNSRYKIDFEALDEFYSDWREIYKPESYGEYIDYGDDGEVAYKKIVWTRNEINYFGGNKSVNVMVQQDAFESPNPDDHVELIPPNPKPTDPGASYSPGWTDEQLEIIKKRNEWPSTVAGWPARFYKTASYSSAFTTYIADVQLDYGYLRVIAYSGPDGNGAAFADGYFSEEEFIRDVRAVLKAQPAKTGEMKQDASEKITFNELSEVVPLNVGDEDGDGIEDELDPNKIRTLTLEELNKKFNISFEALDDIYPDWYIVANTDPYFEYRETADISRGTSEAPKYSRNIRFYSDDKGGNGNTISVIVQQNEFPSPTSDNASRKSSIIEGHTAQFYKFKREDGRDSFLAYVTLENGYLRLTSLGITQEKFIEAVRAVLKTGTVKVEKVKQNIPNGVFFDDEGFWNPYMDAGFDPEKNQDIFIPWTLDEINKWYGIDFEGLNGRLSEWDIHRAPYGEFHSDPGTPASKTINWTRNAIIYTREGNYQPIGVMVQQEAIPVRDSDYTICRDVDGKSVQFLGSDYSGTFWCAIVPVNHGWLEISWGGGLSEDEFTEVVRAIIGKADGSVAVIGKVDSSVYERLNKLSYSNVTCDGLPEFTITADDGTVYQINFTEKWVWRNYTEEAVLTDDIIAMIRK